MGDLDIQSISEMISEVSPFYRTSEGKNKGPSAEHKLVYDSASEGLEPTYFFILDLMNEMQLKTEKVIDNFSPSAASGHFSEMGQRASIMQQQGSKLLADINTVLRSILNIIYDLKEFRIRIQSYDDLKSKNKDLAHAAVLSLKQLWLDKVDFQKGNSSIKAMALGQAGFQTLLDAFLYVKDSKEAQEIDLNDRVKRILKSRIVEFNSWLTHSEVELRKRYELEKTYLKSQVNSLKLYSRWAKPYLLAAQQLERKEGGREPALVKAFNTLLLEMVLIGKKKVDPKKAALEGDLPQDISKMNIKREYYSCVLVEFRFRSIPQRVQQTHYAFGGRAEVSFKAYALSEDELKRFDKKLDDSDVGDVLKLIEGSTGESMKHLQDEIDFFLTDELEGIKKGDSDKDESNPFLALFGSYEKDSSGNKEKKKEMKKEDKVDLSKPMRKDDYIEREFIRPMALQNAKDTAFNLFDIYKKAHGMATFP